MTPVFTWLSWGPGKGLLFGPFERTRRTSDRDFGEFREFREFVSGLTRGKIDEK